MLDGNGKLMWRDTGVHFESVFFGKLDPALPGRQLVVDVAHQAWGKEPLLILDEQGTLLGRTDVAQPPASAGRLVRHGRGPDLLRTKSGVVQCQRPKGCLFDTPMPETLVQQGKR